MRKMFHQMINKLAIIDIHAMRRFGIGAFMALPLIAVLSFMFQHSTPISSVEFDSEKIEIISSHAPKNNANHNGDASTTPHATNDVFNRRASSFPHFARFMSPLTAKQSDAIKNNTPRLTIIINNLGQSRKIIAKVMEMMPPSVTLSLSPYTQNHNEVSKQLNGYEFETWMDIATLTLDKSSDPGANALNPTHNFERNIKALTNQIDGKTNLTGFLLPPQSLIIETPKLWEDLSADLFGQGYGILDNTSALLQPKLFFYGDKRAPYIKGDITINTDVQKKDIEQSLKKIIGQVHEQKNMIVTYSAKTPAALDILSDWINSLDEQNITLVPLSAQAKL
jgi:polysaccharide deacetylase 2 family uncharacterized protein YibQ